jgi:hypothetical protein
MFLYSMIYRVFVPIPSSRHGTLYTNKKSSKKNLGQSLRRSAPNTNGVEMAALPQRSTVGHWMKRGVYSIRSLIGS